MISYLQYPLPTQDVLRKSCVPEMRENMNVLLTEIQVVVQKRSNTVDIRSCVGGCNCMANVFL